MKDLLNDSRVRRLVAANTLGSIGSGVTIFSVPWLMVHRPEGSDAYRWITIATTIVLFAMMPYYGTILDQHSRKRMMLVSELWGLFATTSMAVLGIMLGGFALWQLMAIYFCGMLYYTLSFPARFALIQQLFDRSQYQSLNGLLEIQGQTAMMIAGGLGGYLVDRIPLWAILMFDAATYLTSFLILATLPYRATHLSGAGAEMPGKAPRNRLPDEDSGARPSRLAAWRGITEGWKWLHRNPRLALFLTCSLIPFITVMAANYLFPIYVSETLHASAAWFAGGEITFAAGAICAGALLPGLISQHSTATAITGTIVVFTLGLAVIAVVHRAIVYLACGVLLGFGNAGCRVARSALMMHVVPNQVMGRVGVFYNALDRVLRTVLVMAMAIIDLYGPPAGFAVLVGVVTLALAGVVQSRSAIRDAQATAAA